MSAALLAVEAEAPQRMRAAKHPVIDFAGEAVRLLAIHPSGIPAGQDSERRAVSALDTLTTARAVARAGGLIPEGIDFRLGNALAATALLPSGLRWAPPGLPAWIGALDEATAVAEVAHHLRREAVRAGLHWLRGLWRMQAVSVAGRFLDARAEAGRAALGADPASWSIGQRLGGRMAARGDVDGVLFTSARRRGGTALVVWNAGAVRIGKVGKAFVLRVPAEGAARATRIKSRTQQ